MWVYMSLLPHYPLMGPMLHPTCNFFTIHPYPPPLMLSRLSSAEPSTQWLLAWQAGKLFLRRLHRGTYSFGKKSSVFGRWPLLMSPVFFFTTPWTTPFWSFTLSWPYNFQMMIWHQLPWLLHCPHPLQAQPLWNAALYSLRNNPYLVIKPADKGIAIVEWQTQIHLAEAILEVLRHLLIPPRGPTLHPWTPGYCLLHYYSRFPQPPRC